MIKLNQLSPIPEVTTHSSPSTQKEVPRDHITSQTTDPSTSRRENRPPSLRYPDRNLGNRLTDKVSALWKQLRDATNAISNFEYSDSPDVAPNDSGVCCIKSSMVCVKMDPDENAPRRGIHANYIKIAPPIDPNTPPTARVYVAGQSPNPNILSATETAISANPFLSYEKFLIQGIESRAGIFQFVSRKAHYHPEQSKEKPIIGQLLEKIASLREDQELLIGNRYKIQAEETLLDIGSANEVDDNKVPEYKCIHLIVTDTFKKNYQPVIIPITQVGLKFTDRLLRIADIKKANSILEAHNLNISEQMVLSNQTEPAMISYAGVGRNATLIVYREMSNRIRKKEISDESALDRTLHEIIMQGRKTRGPKFIHSDAQYNELRSALLELMTEQKEVAHNFTSNLSSTSLNTKNNTNESENPHYQINDEKVTEPTAEDLKAIKIARGQTGVYRSEASKQFDQTAFVLRDNFGGGNCLFHALEGTSKNPNLDENRIKIVRDSVANVLASKPDTPLGKRGNWHIMTTSLEQKSANDLQEFLAKYENNEPGRSGLPQEITNIELAELQRMPTYTAGDEEIQQWLELPENQGKVVKVIDGQVGFESIKTFAYQKPVQKIELRDIGVDPKVVKERIGNEIKIAAAFEKAEIDHPSHIVLYRSVSHFQRVIRQKSEHEQKEAIDAKARELAMNRNLVANMTEEQIMRLGTN